MQLRDRIKELRRVVAKELRPSPRNWRSHPQAQRDVLRGVLAEIGYADALIARELEDGSLELIDGHLRAETTPDTMVPVLVTDLDEQEAAKLLATLDPLAAMAEADTERLSELLKSIETDNEAVAAMLAALQAEVEPRGKGTDSGPKPDIQKGASLAELPPIDEELEILRGRRIIVEFSGGKDSSAAAVWASHYMPDAPLELMFCDMGADFCGFSFFLHSFAEWISAKLTVLRSEQNMFDRFLAEGKWPHFRYPYCHEVLHDTMDKHVLAQDPEQIVIMRGGRLQEKAANSKDNKTRWLTIARLPEHKYFQPLYFADKNAGERVLQEAKAPVWEGYGRGLCRTACRICPGQRPIAYATIRREFPDVWAELLEFERRFGPGAWQRRDGSVARSFTELADHAERAGDEEPEDPEDGDDLTPQSP